MNLNLIRELFEERVVPSFPGNSHGVRRKENGEYVSDALEDHWQTFQEGIEIALQECVGICDGVQRQYGQYTFTATKVKENIKQHFGVEE